MLQESDQPKAQSAHEITACLEQWRQGDGAAIRQVYDLIYSELKGNAAVVLARFSPNAPDAMTFSPTDLLHEVSARILSAVPQKKWNHRHEFFALVTKAMLNLLIGNHTRKSTVKHGGQYHIGSLDERQVQVVEEALHPDVIALDQAMNALQQVDPLRHQIIVKHFFEGHTVEAIAIKLKLAKSTVSTKKTIALGWLRTYIQGQG